MAEVAKLNWGLNDSKTENMECIETALQNLLFWGTVANTADALKVTREAIFSTLNGDR